MILVRRVIGGSMTPTLHSGQLVIALKLKPRVNDVVIAKIPGREVIKRVIAADKQLVELAGDNLNSNRYNLEPKQIIGRVIWPKSR